MPASDTEVNIDIVAHELVIRAGLSRHKVGWKMRLPIAKFEIGRAQPIVNVAVASDSGG